MKLATHPRVIERGILTSNYKREIKYQSQQAKAASLARTKSMILNQSNLESQTGTILRVALFLAVILMINF
jgi:hypothetical protein